MMALMKSRDEPYPPFAPPFLKDGDLVISQTANILFYLGPKLNLAPSVESLRYVANGLQLTIADVVTEAHDTHHPLASGLYYEDQKDAAKVRAHDFIDNRIPKFMSYFERVLKQNPAGDTFMVGDALTLRRPVDVPVDRRSAVRVSARAEAFRRTLSAARRVARRA